MPQGISREDTAIISTSDRIAFRSCRRKWNWSSHLRQALAPAEQKHPLWFGSGMHHCLEDMFGPQKYQTITAAVEDYTTATLKHYKRENLPETFDEDIILMERMLKHYKYGFLKNRDALKTYVVGGEPQVEVAFEFEIPVPKAILGATPYKRAVYRGVIDRVVIDEDGYLWIQDYKNVAAFTKPIQLELDSQIGVYLWAASYIYRRPVLGFIYTQILKRAVESPRILQSGEISTAKDQSTTHALYRAALLAKYGPNTFPEKHMDCLNFLASLEEDEADKFVRRDRVTRNKSTMRAEGDKILAEVSEMLNPTLPIYPNPGFMCANTCSFIQPCIEMDAGELYRTTLQAGYKERTYGERNDWRKYLKMGRKQEKPMIVVGAKDTTTLPY